MHLTSAPPRRSGVEESGGPTRWALGAKLDTTLLVLEEATGNEIIAIVGSGGSSTEVPTIHNIAKITEQETVAAEARSLYLVFIWFVLSCYRL